MAEEGGEQGTRQRHGRRRRGHERLLLHFHRRRHWRPLLRLHRDGRRPLLGFFTAHGGAAPSHLQPPLAATHGEVLCQHGWRRGLPRRACTASLGWWLATAGGAGSPGRVLPWRAVLPPLAVGQRRPGGAVAGQRRGDGGTKKGRQLGFERRSHRFIYRRAKWASWAFGPSC
jgi:hypothetical protein